MREGGREAATRDYKSSNGAVPVNIMAQPLSPFHGWPLTREYREPDGTRAFRCTARILTPLRAKAADYLATASAIGLFLLGAKAVAEMPRASGWHWLAVVGGAVLSHQPLKAGLRQVFRAEIAVVVGVKTFRVRTLFGWRTYDRELKHKFTLIPHDKARSEHRNIEFRTRKAAQGRRVIAPAYYYGESYHVIYQCLGQRNDIATVYDRKEALAILTRLQACDEVLEGDVRRGDGEALRPKDQWGLRPGDIPEGA